MRRESVAVLSWLPGVLMAVALLLAVSRKVGIALSDRRAAQAHGQAKRGESRAVAEHGQAAQSSEAGLGRASRVGATTRS